MAKLINNRKQGEELADVDLNSDPDKPSDALMEIRNFIQRRTLENRVLKELTNELLMKTSPELKKPDSTEKVLTNNKSDQNL
jgi:hypothetical protein